MKKLVVIFPGAGYGIDCPLLYYADFVFETNGYERKHMHYQDILLNKKILSEEKMKQLRNYVWNQASLWDFKEYEEIVFISKSIGTIEAGWLAETLKMKVTQVFLTPVEQAMPYCTSDSYVVIGTNDRNYPIYKQYCDKWNIKTLYIDGANHSLEVEGKPYESIDVLKKIMKFIER